MLEPVKYTKMTIKELCKVCSEYDLNLVKISILKQSILGNAKFPHLKWAIDRDTQDLSRLNERQTEIQKQILKRDTIIF